MLYHTAVGAFCSYPNSIYEPSELSRELDHGYKGSVTRICPRSIGLVDFQPSHLPALCEDLTRQVLKAYCAKLNSQDTIDSINQQLDRELIEDIIVQ